MEPVDLTQCIDNARRPTTSVINFHVNLDNQLDGARAVLRDLSKSENPVVSVLESHVEEIATANKLSLATYQVVSKFIDLLQSYFCWDSRSRPLSGSILHLAFNRVIKPNFKENYLEGMSNLINNFFALTTNVSDAIREQVEGLDQKMRGLLQINIPAITKGFAEISTSLSALMPMVNKEDYLPSESDPAKTFFKQAAIIQNQMLLIRYRMILQEHRDALERHRFAESRTTYIKDSVDSTERELTENINRLETILRFYEEHWQKHGASAVTQADFDRINWCFGDDMDGLMGRVASMKKGLEEFVRDHVTKSEAKP